MSEVVFRLFVSSPGDVAAERARAEAVVEKLNAEFKDRARFAPVFWEDHFYSAHETFQKQIPEAADCDLVAAIFRARLGSPLPDGFVRQPDGARYPSGSAYEVLSAIAKRQGGAVLPDIYVFRYPRGPQVDLDDPNFDAIQKQWSALKDFFERWFKTPSGQFVAGFQSYDSADDFADRLEKCLSQWLAARGIVAREVWDRARLGSPFPGLAAFGSDRQHVFFGRDLAIRQASERLRQAKTPFLLILGASGSGKSSLLRAGLMPKLLQPGAIPEVDLFRPVTMTPGLDPFAELAEALLAQEALGCELAGGRFADMNALTEALRGDAKTAAGVIGEALDRAAEARREAAHFDKPRPARLLLAVDQAERLFMEAPKDADAFGALVQALAGPAARVIMVMRADAYARFQTCAPLLALRAEGATFDLMPPTASELEDIVKRPVDACQPPLAFAPSVPALPDRLVADAKGGDALPLLQMTLEGLYKAQETRRDGELRPEDYKGMAAAVTEAANAAMAHLGERGRKALEALVAGLVADVAPDPITAEPAPIVVALDRDAFVKGSLERAALVDAFIEARLLTLEGGGRVRPTHEALLRIWPEAAALVKDMGPLIRARHALAPLAQAWAEAGRDEKAGHLEISAPLLAAGQQLTSRFGEDLGTPLRPFMVEAEKADAARRAGATRRRRIIFGAIVGALVVMTGLAGAALLQRREALAQKATAVQAKNEALSEKAIALDARNDAIAQKALADQSRNEAVEQKSAADRAKNEALSQKAAAERNLTLATEAANSLVFDVALKFREVSGIPASVIKSILQRALDLQQKLLSSGQSSPDLLLSEAGALAQTSATLLTLGDTSGALDAARKAAGVSQSFLDQHPENKVWQGFLAMSDQMIGEVEVKQGHLPSALDSFRAAFAIVDRLAKSDPNNMVWQGSLAIAYEKVGDVEVAQGQLAPALDAYQADYAILDRLAKSDPANAMWQRNLSVAYEKVGGVQATQGHLAQALDAYRAEFATLDRLAKSDPGNAALQRSLSIAYEKIGTIEVAQGQLAPALDAYRAEFTILDRLVKSDPGNADWRLSLSIANEKIGDVQVAQGHPAQALDAYRAEFTTLDDLAKSDPGNAALQRSLSIAYEKIGVIEVAQGRLAPAHDAFQAEFAILDRLVKSDPGNADWRHSLGIALVKIGSVELAQGEVAQALGSYKSSMVIMEALAKSDPSNIHWQFDLTTSYELVATVELKNGQFAEAAESYRAALPIAERLAKSDPSNSEWQSLLSLSHQSVGLVERMKGELSPALESYEAALTIIERLAKSDPSNANWQDRLLLAYETVGEIEFQLNHSAHALDSYQAAFAIAERLAELDPTNQERQFNLAACYFGLGLGYVHKSDKDQARKMLGEGRAIMATLVARSPDHMDWKANLAAFEQQLAALKP